MATIMIVEDDEVIAEALSDALALDGLETVTVSDPKNAIGLARLTPPDAFLVDLMLPGQSGIELAQELAELGFTAIIGMSASSYIADVARESGVFAAVLDKPFDFDEMLVAVLEVIPSHFAA